MLWGGSMSIVSKAKSISLIFFFLSSYAFASGPVADNVKCQSALLNNLIQYEVKPVRSVFFNGQEIKRFKLCINGRVCVVLVNKPQLFPEDQQVLEAILGLEGRIYSAHGIESVPAVNCHAFACYASDLPGLPKHLWIESIASELTNGTNPLEFILREFFIEVESYSRAKSFQFVHDQSLLFGDLVSLVDQTGAYVHSGTIIKELLPTGETVNWIRSKLGETDIVETPLKNLQRIYDFSEISVFRRR